MDAANWIKQGLGAALVAASIGQASAGDRDSAENKSVHDRRVKSFEQCFLDAAGRVVGKDLSDAKPKIEAGESIIEVDLDFTAPPPLISFSMAAIWKWDSADPPPLFNGEQTLISFYDVTEIATGADGEQKELTTGGMTETLNGELLQVMDYAAANRNPQIMPLMREKSRILNEEIRNCSLRAIS